MKIKTYVSEFVYEFFEPWRKNRKLMMVEIAATILILGLVFAHLGRYW